MTAAAPDCLRALAYAGIARDNKAFALASRLLPADVCDLSLSLYAYCRRAGDALEYAREPELPLRIEGLRRELDAVYAGFAIEDPIAAGFQGLVRARAIPRVYAEELIAGLALDALGAHYESQRDLLRHCYRVAGTLALMMCHATGVRDERALLHAAHLGIAMQLTAICRDVQSDWERGRLYLPADLLAAHGAGWLVDARDGPFPAAAAAAAARAIAALLDEADLYYASADAGIALLAPRCTLAIRTARLLHAEIGSVIRKRGCDPRAQPAVVPARIKLLLAARAGAGLLGARSAEGGDVPRTALEDSSAVLQRGPRDRRDEAVERRA
jgi:phytoene synthase